MSAQVEATASPHLRALSVGDLLDESIRLYRRSWLQLVTIAAITALPLTVLDLAFAILSASAFSSFGTVPGPVDLSESFLLPLVGQAGRLIVALISLVLNTGLMFGALVYAAGQSYLGRPIATRQAYRSSLRRFLVIVGTFIVLFLVTLILLVATLIPCIGWLGGPAVLAFVTVNLAALIMPVIMLEGKGVWASLQRSWALAKSQFWRVLFIMFVTWLLNLALVSGPSGVAMVLIVTLAKNPMLVSVANVVTSALVSLIFTPLWGVCMTVLYYDARVRREAFDLDLIAGTETVPEDEHAPLFVRSDWKTLGFLTLVMVPGSFLILLAWPMLVLGFFRALQGLP